MLDTALLCEICGKAKNTGRDGSLTQFVFRAETCRCEFTSLAKFQKKLEQTGNGNGDHNGNGTASSSGNGNGRTVNGAERSLNGSRANFVDTAPSAASSTVASAASSAAPAASRAVAATIPHGHPAPEQELQLPPGSFPAERYAPVKVLGRGAAGTVYLCKDRLLGDKYVAVKVLNTVDAEKLLAFHHEAKTTSRLNHPNVILGLNFGATTNGAPYLVMEYCNGSTLEQFYTYSQEAKARVARDRKAQLEREKHAADHAWSDKKLVSSNRARLENLQDTQQAQTQTSSGWLTPKEAVDVFSAICRALTYTHSNGVYHRDLKPSNVLLQRDEGNKLRVRLIDFGIAAVKEATLEPTIFQGKTIAGTPSYMSPDVARGRSYDVRSEIYSLGCVMFEALSGQLPFKGETSLETLQMHAHAKAPVLSDICPGAEFKGLSKIVERCIEKDPDSRFQSAEELRHALEGVIKYDTGSEKELDTLSVQKPRWTQRLALTPLYAVSIALVALLLACLFIFIAEPDFIASRLENGETDKSKPHTSSSSPVITKHPQMAINHGKQANPEKASSSKPTTSLLFDRMGDPFPELEAGPVYVQKHPGEDFDEYIVQGHVKGDELKILQGKTYIKRLDLRFDDLPGDRCKYLVALPLERINFLGSELDEQSFVHIARVKTLVQLTFQGCTGVSDDAVRHLQSLPNLLFLRIGDTAITDKSVDTFLKLHKLKELRLSGCRGITSAGLLKLSAMKNLDTLTFRNCNVDDGLLRNLDKFKHLNYLGLSELDNDSVKYLLNLKISALAIGAGNRLTDRGLLALSKMKNLRTLMLAPNPLLTKYGTSAFTSRNQKCNLILADDEGPVQMMYTEGSMRSPLLQLKDALQD